MDPTVGIQHLLGIPYVEDGMLDAHGCWTYFGHPEIKQPHPGLNCSGFLVAAAQHLLGCRLTLQQITQDRLSDSGQGAPQGKDWDFGWDLILNLSEGLTRRWIVPNGTSPIGSEDARITPGFRIQDSSAWTHIFPRMQDGRIYLASLWRTQRTGIRHHHVALLLRDSSGRTWFYQTLPGGRTHRLQISSAKGFARLCEMFGPSERILLLEVEPTAST
ncbi:MAG: hypothetical protein Q8O00_08765 [Holophaga sp.]|nr:hypothetical protein [Holophaga sp.]